MIARKSNSALWVAPFLFSISAATLVALLAYLLGSPSSRRYLTSVPSDERGAFRIEGVTPNHYLLVARAKGYGKNFETIEGLQADRGDILLTLQPGTTIAGVVRRADGNPAADVNVQVYPVDVPFGRSAGEFDGDLPMLMAQAVGTGDDQGHYHISGLLPGRYRLTIDAAHHLRLV